MGRKRIRLERRRVRLERKRIQLNKRVVRPWRPSWENEIRGWTINYIAKNKWRYEAINDFEDLLQDAYLVFLKVAETYPRVVEAPHFMSLYKTSLTNAFTDKAREYGRKVALIDEAVDTATCVETVSVEPDVVSGPLLALLNNGPEELRLFMDFLGDDANLERLREPQREVKGQPRMTFDQRISKLLGVEHFPFRSTLKQLLAS